MRTDNPFVVLQTSLCVPSRYGLVFFSPVIQCPPFSSRLMNVLLRDVSPQFQSNSNVLPGVDVTSR